MYIYIYIYIYIYKEIHFLLYPLRLPMMPVILVYHYIIFKMVRIIDVMSYVYVILFSIFFYPLTMTDSYERFMPLSY